MSKDDLRPHIDFWKPNQEDMYVQYDGKLVIVPFDNLIKGADDTLNTFVIKKDVYKSKLNIITSYINYFIKYYDTDRELILAYYKLKYIIDDKERRKTSKPLTIKKMRKYIFDILFTESIKEKVRALVNDNYQDGLLELPDEADKSKYPKSLQFNDEHGRLLLVISTCMKIMCPVMFHYMSTYNCVSTPNIYKFYEDFFYKETFHTNISIQDKLWLTTESKIRGRSKDRKIWDQREIFGDDEVSVTEFLLNEKLIAENIFKYNFTQNIVKFNSVILEKQIDIFIKQNYGATLVELSTKKDMSGLSAMDKFEINSAKIDESLIILSDVNIKNTIKKLTNSLKIDIEQDELKYYMMHHKYDKFQVKLLFYHYAKYFLGYRDLKVLTKKQYTQLLVILKRKLQIQGYVYLPQIISGNIEGKLNSRLIKNNKFMNKILLSPIYQNLVKDRYSTLEDIKKSDVIRSMISQLTQTEFTYVDYDNQDLLHEPIEINQDAVCDEFINFVSHI